LEAGLKYFITDTILLYYISILSWALWHVYFMVLLPCFCLFVRLWPRGIFHRAVELRVELCMCNKLAVSILITSLR
jgi:hypothetical protein